MKENIVVGAGVSVPWIIRAFNDIPGMCEGWMPVAQFTACILSICYLVYHIKEKRIRIKIDLTELKKYNKKRVAIKKKTDK